MGMEDARSQHAREIAETKEFWERKPLLRISYRKFFHEISSRLREGSGLTLELGSGIGALKEVIPDCITTDVFENPLVDRVEDAYALRVSEGSVTNLILFDVWHHLEYPGSALKEFYRVLEPGGRLILFEPAALSVLGRLVFGLCHHEPIHAPSPQEWFVPAEVDPKRMPYYAAQGNAWKVFRRKRLPEPFFTGWHRLEVAYFPAFDWLAAGGFRGRQLCPACLHPLLQSLSKAAAFCPSIFATRMMVVLEKNVPPYAEHE